jgi:uncharacterized protein (UPF0548 family)
MIFLFRGTWGKCQCILHSVLLILLFVPFSAPILRVGSGIPVFSLFPPKYEQLQSKVTHNSLVFDELTKHDILGLLTDYVFEQHNYKATDLVPITPSATVNLREPAYYTFENDVCLGPSSPQIFEKASKVIKDMSVLNMSSWTTVTTAPDAKLLFTYCVSVRCFRIVTVINPCRVCSVFSSIPERVCYTRAATLNGHALRGEDFFGVYERREPTVNDGKPTLWFRQYSRSQPAGLFGVITLPIIRYHQRKFFREQIKHFRNFVFPSP